MSGRGHQLIHSDALSAELEALGLDSSIFGAAGIPAPIFQALLPRRAGVFDEHAHTFGTGDEPASSTRASDGIYRDANGVYQIAADGAIRAEYSAAGVFLGYLFEPAITNKCTNFNAAPDAGLSNLTKAGDGAATMTRVDDAAALASAGLGTVCPSGLAVKLDNSAGSTGARIEVAGVTGNTNDHTFSAWARRLAGAAGHFRIGNNTSTILTSIDNETYARAVVTGTPGTGSQKLTLHASAGAIGVFVLNQLEEISVPTSPIITAGASATRAVDDLSWGGRPAGFDHDQGMVVCSCRPGFAHAALAANSTLHYLTIRNGKGLLYGDFRTDPAVRVLVFDGTTAASASLAIAAAQGQLIKFAARWSSSANKLVAGIAAAGVWSWDDRAYDGAFVDDDTWEVFSLVEVPMHIHSVRLFNRYLSESLAERIL